ncbi:hypothetical protein MKQ68_00780 [Chitinophaga horti]|uniref:Uncharacterized protein n=1 Tax=Chitinophaga horti TaxID=2920382 RepID=A0ABY6J1S3_9BACT|nr:hypothetical protein [Chitinophaga horti]UYQ93634.1 hypothetical protein MKQ68_00780 [Chitinophaga horti]
MKIAPDKWRHFYVGIAMGAVLQIAAGWWFATLLAATIAAFIVSWLISYGFELFSLVTGYGHYDFMDAVASMIGAILGMAPVFIWQY